MRAGQRFGSGRPQCEDGMGFMQTLVTGGGGFLGRYVAEQLLQRGDTVRVLARGDYPELTSQGMELIRGDLRDAAVVRRACEGVESVFHVAAVPGIWGSRRMFHEINVVGTQNVLEACHASGVARLIHTSSPSVVFDGQDHVDADETLPYASRWLCYYPWSKALAEQQVLSAHQTDGLRTLALRPHLIWGPRDNHLIPRLLQTARAGRLRRVGTGGNVVSVSYVENTAAAHLAADRALSMDGSVGGQPYFINEPEAVNLWTWIDDLLRLAGISPVERCISAASAYYLGAACEVVWAGLRLSGEPRMTRFVARQLSGSHSYRIQSALEKLGYAPSISMAEGMRRLEQDLPRMLQ